METGMVNRLIFYVLLDTNAVSICNYKRCVSDQAKLIDKDLLKEIIDYANENDHIVSFIHGDFLSEEYLQLISHCVKQTHFMSIDVFNQLPGLPNTIISLCTSEYSRLSKRSLSKDLNRAAIVHFDQSNVGNLCDSVLMLLRVTRRISVVCDDFANLTDDYRGQYLSELSRLTSIIKMEVQRNKLTEVNVLTDDVLLDGSNQCPAGVNSFAVSSDGKLYPCPAFANSKACELHSSYKEVSMTNSRKLFSLRPICSNCNIYHCRRCAFINYTFTKEICIPPYGLCEVGALEHSLSEALIK